MGDITITNSTISHDLAATWFKEGGVINWGRMTIISSTFAGNTNPYYAGRFSLLNKRDGILSLSQTVVTGQFISDGITINTGPVLINEGTILKSEYNLFGENSLSSAEAFDGFTPGPTDVIVTSDSNQPTALKDILDLTMNSIGETILNITDNGGPTSTVTLVPGSPAIDAAGTDCEATDQRGVTRSIGSACDIGAFEAPLSFPPVVELSDLDGQNGYVINGVAADDVTGRSVSDAGDVNGDGLADLINGAEEASPNGEDSGAGFVVFGRDTATQGNFPAVLALSALDGSNGFVINGVNAHDHAGRSVSGAGDINHDGVADLLIGATGADANGEDAGAAYVVFGKNTGSEGEFPASLALSALNGSNGFLLNGANAGDAAGLAVSGAGDVNADGIDDLLLGAPDADPNGDRSGSAYVVFGRDTAGDGDFPATIELSALDGSNGFTIHGEGVRISGDRAGFSVSGSGDLNADSIADVLIGSIGANRSYVVYGKDTASDGGFTAEVELSKLNGGNGFALHGVNAGDGAGRVSGAGDINHDGAADLLIGAPGADPNGAASGAGYVVYGLVSDDADRDGITDDKDNCILQTNGPLGPDAGGNIQRDTDGDDYGNVCDPDFDNSGNVDFADLAHLKSKFFTSDEETDLNGDGKVDFADLAILKSVFFGSPGPSGLVQQPD